MEYIHCDCVSERRKATYIAARLPAFKKFVETALEVIDQNNEFRKGMPAEWEGDPLQDAIERLKKSIDAMLQEHATCL